MKRVGQIGMQLPSSNSEDFGVEMTVPSQKRINKEEDQIEAMEEKKSEKRFNSSVSSLSLSPDEDEEIGGNRSDSNRRTSIEASLKAFSSTLFNNNGSETSSSVRHDSYQRPMAPARQQHGRKQVDPSLKIVHHDDNRRFKTTRQDVEYRI